MNSLINIQVRAATAQARRELATLKTQVAALEAELAKAGGAATSAFSGGAMTALSKWGSQIQWAGRQLVTNFTLPIGLAATAATNWALEVDAGMVRVKKVYGDAATGAQAFARDVDGLTEAFDLLSVKYAKSKADVVDIAGDWAAAGATGGALARGVEETLKVMVLGEMDAAEATEALIAIQAQYGASTERLTEIVAILNSTENATGVTFQGLVEGMARSASAARTAGVDVGELAGMIASLSPAAGTAGQAGNALKTIFSRLMGPTNEAREVLGLMGINIDDVGWKSLNGAERLRTLANAYTELSGASDDTISAQAGVVSAVVASRWQINKFDVLMRDLATSMNDATEAGGYYGKTQEILADSSAVLKTAQDELKAVLESNPEQVKRAGVIIQNSFIKVIASVMPQIMAFINAIASIADAFANMDPNLQKVILTFAAFLAVLGPPMVLLGSFAVAIGQVGRMASSVAGKLGALFGISSKAKKALDVGSIGEVNSEKARRAIEREIIANQNLESARLRSDASAIRSRAQYQAAVANSARATSAVQVTEERKASIANSIAIGQKIANEKAAADAARLAATQAASAKRASDAAAELSARARNSFVIVGYSQELTVARSTATQQMTVWATSVAAMETTLVGALARMDVAWATYMAGVRAHIVNTFMQANGMFTAGLIESTAAYQANLSGQEMILATSLAKQQAQRMAFEAAVVNANAAASVARMRQLAQEAAAWSVMSRTMGTSYATGLMLMRGASAEFVASLRALGPSFAAQGYQWGSLTAQGFALGMRQIGAATVPLAITQGVAPKLITAGAVAGSAGGVATGRAFATGAKVSLLGGLKGAGAAVVLAFKGLPAKIGAAIKAAGPAIIATLKTWGPKIIAFLAGPWGIAIAAVLTLFTLFGKQIGQLWDVIVAEFQTNGSWLNLFARRLGDMWNSIVGVINRAFQALPEAVRAPIEAMLNMIKRAALAVYEWFSYINPFAHHSPSLVENVTAGMQIVGDRFGLAADVIKKHMMSAYSSLKMFGQATKSFMADYAAATFAAEKAVVKKHAGGGAAASMQELHDKLPPLYEQLTKITAAIAAQEKAVEAASNALDAAQAAVDGAQAKYDSLTATLDKLGAKLDAAQAKLDGFADMPIEGMKAMNDAIFENEMAQKRLQLELLKMGDVDISDLEGQLSSLQGEIESLRGEQADLRNAGAGSDILAAYDEQIKQLEAQQGAIEASVAPMNEMQKQLEELQKQGEILDLENAIQFDPLKKQVDELTSSYKEMPFDEIVAGIASQKQVVDQLQASYDAQNKKVEDQQKVLDSANKTLEQAQAKYDAQKASLDALQSTYSAVEEQIRAIEEAIQDVVAAAQEMQSALEAAKSAKASSKGSGTEDGLTPAGQNFVGAAGGGFPDVGDDFVIGDEDFGIDQWLEDFESSTSDLFSGLDPFAGLKEKWNSFTQWWGQNVTPVWEAFWKGLTGAVSQVDWLGPIQRGFQSVIAWFGSDNPLAIAIRNIWKILTDGWSDIWEGAKTAFENIKKVLQGPLEKLWTAISDAWTDFWTAVKDGWEDFKPVLDVLVKVWGAAMAPIATAVSLIGTVLWNVFTNVIGPVFENIVGLVATVIEVFAGIITFFSGVFIGDWSKAWQGIKDIFTALWSGIVRYFEGMVKILIGFFKGIGEGAREWFAWMREQLAGIVTKIREGITNRWNAIKQAVINAAKATVEWVVNKWVAFRERVTNITNAIKEAFIKKWNDIKTGVTNKIKDLVTWAVTKWENFKKDLTKKVVEIAVNLIKKWEEIKTKVRDKVKSLIDTVVNWFTKWKGRITNAIGSVKDALKQKGIDLILGAKRGIEEKWEAVKEWFLGLKDKIKAFIKNPGDILKSAGKNIIDGFFNGLKSKWDEVKGWVTGIGDWIADNKGPKAYDLALLVPAGNWIMTGLQDGMKAQMPALEKTLSGVASTVSNSMTGIGSTAFQSMNTSAAQYATQAMVGGGSTQTAIPTTINENKTVNFYGDLSFPNIESPEDADAFLGNLADLAGAER